MMTSPATRAGFAVNAVNGVIAVNGKYGITPLTCNPHVIRNARSVRALLENCGKRVIVFQGHMHSGHESETNSICYHTLKSLVNGRTHTCYWIVEVNANGMFIDRYDSTISHGKAKREAILKNDV